MYWADGQLVPEGCLQPCHILRDVQAGQAVQFDIMALDIARGVYGWLRANGSDKPLIINSGYRSPRTNANEGGVRNSLHCKAQALDLRIEGVSSAALSRFGRYLAGGGAGYHPSAKFTHLDRGRVRHWVGWQKNSLCTGFGDNWTERFLLFIVRNRSPIGVLTKQAPSYVLALTGPSNIVV